MLLYYNNANINPYIITTTVMLRTIEICGNSKLRIIYIIIDDMHSVARNFRGSSTGSKKYTVVSYDYEENL